MCVGSAFKRATLIVGQRVDLTNVDRQCSKMTCGRRACEHRQPWGGDRNDDRLFQLRRWPSLLRDCILDMWVTAYGAAACQTLTSLFGAHAQPAHPEIEIPGSVEETSPFEACVGKRRFSEMPWTACAVVAPRP